MDDELVQQAADCIAKTPKMSQMFWTLTPRVYRDALYFCESLMLVGPLRVIASTLLLVLTPLKL